MAHFYRMLKLGSPADWKGLAGEEKWVPTRSAYEIAHSWHGANGIPRGISQALETSGADALSGLRLQVALVEKPTFLDTSVAPSMTDIMGYARNPRDETVILAVEGKATEPFGAPVKSWVRGDVTSPPEGTLPRVTRVKRLEFLAARLGITAAVDSALAYQLLHRTVSGLIEAALHGAVCAVLIVHSFADADDDNWRAFGAFVAALGIESVAKGKVAGPVNLRGSGDIPLYALWYQDTPRV
jgi:hypothetical protein